jgi:hypothetical protein
MPPGCQWGGVRPPSCQQALQLATLGFVVPGDVASWHGLLSATGFTLAPAI